MEVQAGRRLFRCPVLRCTGCRAPVSEHASGRGRPRDQDRRDDDSPKSSLQLGGEGNFTLTSSCVAPLCFHCGARSPRARLINEPPARSALLCGLDAATPQRRSFHSNCCAAMESVAPSILRFASCITCNGQSPSAFLARCHRMQRERSQNRARAAQNAAGLRLWIKRSLLHHPRCRVPAVRNHCP